MNEWLDVTEASIKDSYKCFIRCSKILEVRFEKSPDNSCIIALYEDCGATFEFQEKTIQEGYKRFNSIAEKLGIPNLLEDKPTAISAFRQQEEANRKKKRTVAEI